MNSSNHNPEAHHRPPILALLVELLLALEHDSLIGDMEEEYHDRVRSSGRVLAGLFFWFQVLHIMPVLLLQHFIWSFAMWTNYLKVALRNLLRYKGFSLINIFGLAIGVACCILMFLFVQHELSYDRYHENSSRIFRVIRDVDGFKTAPTAFALAPALNQDFPDIKAVRVRRDRQPALLRQGEKQFLEDRLFWVDAATLRIFSFPQLSGDPQTALREAYTAVLTRATAEKYFGEIDVVGRHLSLRWNNQDHNIQITGVLEDVPSTSHFGFDILLSFATAEAIWPKAILEDWRFTFAHTYVLLPEGHSKSAFEAQFQGFVQKHLGAEEAQNYKTVLAYLQPITDIHLHSQIGGEIEENGNISYVYIAALLGFFVLLIACINHMNLATAKSARRSKEVGIRKVAGAHRGQIINQFLAESMLLTAIAFFLALIAVEFSLPLLNEVVGKNLVFDLNRNGQLIFSVFALFMFVGFASGSYPAFYLSAFRPAEIFKDAKNAGSTKSFLRKALVVSQFAIAIILLICTTGIYQQLQFAKNKRLGYNKEQILVIPQGRQVRDNPDLLKNEFLSHPSVRSVSISSHIPTERLSIAVSAIPEGGNPDKSNEPWPITAVSVDEDFFDTFEIDVVQGRTFSKEFGTDEDEAFLLNEAALKALGWETAVGKTFEATYNTGSSSQPTETRKGRIVGVVKDIHFESIHHEIEPMVYFIKPFWYFYISLKLDTENLPQTIAAMEQIWQEIVPGYPFEFTFVDDNFDKLYRTEEALAKGISAFSFLGIFITCLGLLSLISYLAERRTKEISIRKVLGATSASIFNLLSKEFLKLALLANLVAWPVAFLTLNRWLQNFAYRADLSPWIFIVAGLVALFIAFLSVSYQAIKAALINPARTLQYE